MLKLFVPLILSAVIFLAGCGQEDTPEAALDEIKIALAERNSEKLSERVNLDEFFSTTYDAATVALAENYDDFQAKYPDDPYFQHSADFLTTYNAEHKARHLKFLDGVKEAFFAKVPEPATPEENPPAYIANEFEKLRQATEVIVKETRIDGNHATILLDVRGDNSMHGQLVGRLILELVFHRDAKNLWHFDAIKNLDALTPALVDKAELVWITFF